MLQNEIGLSAGIIWNLLAEKGNLTIREIGKFTDFKDSLINMALGWLSRENKIRFLDENGHLYIGLNHPISETYY